MANYASGTTVSATKTRDEIAELLRKRGATKILTYEDSTSLTFAMGFEFDGVPFRLSLPLPSPNHRSFTHHDSGPRTEGERVKRYEAEVNRRWRAFGMVIKAKIVAVEEGISTMQAEFIGNAILSNGMTVAETHADELKTLAALGRLPALALPGGQS